jgi:predicted amidohydrolase YtcJ
MRRTGIALMLWTLLLVSATPATWLLAAPEAAGGPPDLVFYNGTILTMDSRQTTAQALAVSGDHIVAVGDNATIRALAGKSTRTIDLEGRALLPGFIDSKVAGPFGFWELGEGIRLTEDSGAPMSRAETIEAAIQSWLSSHKLAQGQWVVAAGFDPRLAGTRHFNKELGDKLIPRNPLLMLSLDHHVAILNTLAIDALALKTMEFLPAEGEAEKDSQGQPTGVLREVPVFLAMNKVWGQLPAETRRQATVSFLDAAARFGITTVGTPLATLADLETAESLLKDREMQVRVVAEALGPNKEARNALDAYSREKKSPDADRLQVGPPMYPLDGTLISGKAALFQGYQDAPWTSGSLAMSPEEIQGRVKEWASGKQSVVLDASGSLAVHLVVLDASEQAKASAAGAGATGSSTAAAAGEAKPVLRINGLEMMEGADRARLPQLADPRIVVSLQPTIFPYRMYLANALGDERMKQALPYRSLVDAGVNVAISSNWPMSAATFQPTRVLHWAVTRTGWHPEEALSMEQALRAYTAGAARALGLESQIGSIEAGKKADLVVLDRNPLSLASTPDELPNVAVRMTVASGSVIFEERKVASSAPRQQAPSSPGDAAEGTALAARK